MDKLKRNPPTISEFLQDVDNYMEVNGVAKSMMLSDIRMMVSDFSCNPTYTRARHIFVECYKLDLLVPAEIERVLFQGLKADDMGCKLIGESKIWASPLPLVEVVMEQMKALQVEEGKEPSIRGAFDQMAKLLSLEPNGYVEIPLRIMAKKLMLKNGVTGDQIRSKYNSLKSTT